MSREIKFRAWDTHFHCYEQLDLLFTIRKGSPKRWLLEQYTGLKDKNGKEIYEGDIVVFGSSGGAKRGYVAYADEFASFEVYSKRNFIIVGLFRYAGNVIGNIHENPELLENNK